MSRPIFQSAMLLAAIISLSLVVGLSSARAEDKPKAPAGEGPLGTSALRARQEMQLRARDMARELLNGILDMQLKQLEQNGLEKHDIYRDIQNMHRNIDGLVEVEMRDVVDLLVRAQQADPEQRPAYFTRARAEVRQIVARLAAERQNLAHRLRVAQLSAQVKMLIEKQTGVRRATGGLAEQPGQLQADRTLDSLQNQRDVQTLFVQLVNSLVDVATWGGPVGAGAADGLRILKAGQAGQEVDRAVAALESSKFTDAVTSQQSVISALWELLLEKLEAMQGLVASTDEEALAAVRDLMKRQETLRHETKQADLADRASEELTDREGEIHKDLAQLNTLLDRLPAAQPLLEQAKKAAYNATGDLFDKKKSEALDEQSKTSSALAQLERKLMQAAEQESADKSAAELAQEVKNLEKVQKQLSEAQQDEHQASAAAQSKQPQAAAQADQRAAEALAAAADSSPLPPAVKYRLDEAHAQAAAAAKSAENQSASPAEQQADQQAAGESLDRAAAEVNAALNDARLSEKAVSAGELARAAEALERAAAAERQIAQQTADGLDKAEAKRLGADQAEVKRVANKIAEGVKDRSPDAAATLAAAHPPIDAVARDLAAAEKQSGDATKPTAADAAKHGNEAAEKLSTAAAQLREAVAKKAKELAQIARGQMKPVAEARDNVAAASAKQPDAASAMERIAEAEKKLAEAAAEQRKAEGHPQAAAAETLAQKIAAAQQQQRAADQAADDLANGKSDSSFEAATAQQKVADTTASLNRAAATRPQAQAAASDPLEQALEKAQKSAAEAAKQTVAGSPRSAAAAREQAGASLDEALKIAQSEAEQAAKGPAGARCSGRRKMSARPPPRRTSWRLDAAPQAAHAMQQATQDSSRAEKALAAKDQAAAGEAQHATGESLKQASEQLGQAKRAMAEKEANGLSNQSGQLGQLAKDTAPIDPDAAAALQEAERAAAQAGQQGEQGQQGQQGQHQSGQKSQSGQGQKGHSQSGQNQSGQNQTAAGQAGDAAENAGQSGTDVKKALDRADASLAAHQDRLENAKGMAQQMADAANGQQQARDDIISAAKKLLEAAGFGKSSPPGNPSGQPPSQNNGQAQNGQAQNGQANSGQGESGQNPSTAALAKALRDAQDRFAQAQRQIGEQAATGFRPIASRQQTGSAKGLEAASQLHNADQPPGGGDKGTGGDEQQAGSPGQSGQGNPSAASGQPQQGQGQQSASKGLQAGQSQSGQGQSGQGQASGSGSGQMSALGSGLVPSAPETTAEQIAGKSANALAAQALAKGQGQGQGQGQGSGQSKGQEPGSSQCAQPGSNGAARGGGGVKIGSRSSNPALEPGAIQSSPQSASQQGSGNTPSIGTQGNPQNSAGDSKNSSKAVPWIAKLSPEARDAIRAKSHRPAPKVYEDRLKSYFENIED